MKSFDWFICYLCQFNAKLGLGFIRAGVMVVAAVSVSSPLLHAQVVVQLPQYSQFSVNSSFFVPDGGTVYQGGVGRMGMGYNSSGIPILGNVPGLGRLGRNRGNGYSTSSTGVFTTARVYNMREIGDGILNGTHDSFGNRISSYSRNTSVKDSFSQAPYRQVPYVDPRLQSVDARDATANSYMVGPYRNSAPTGIPNASTNQAGVNTTSLTKRTDRNSQSSSSALTPEQVLRRARFLKANLGRNR